MALRRPREVKTGTIGALLFGLAVSAGAGPSPERPVCAVIPFENLSGRPASGYLSGVIHQALYPPLERRRAWRLVDRAKVRALLEESDLKSAGIATGKPARIAGADMLVLGEYRDDQGMVTVTARLVDAVSGDDIRQAHWTGHVSGLSDAMPPRVSAALAGEPEPADGLPSETVARFETACRHLDRGRVDEALAACDAILAAHRRDVATLLLRGYAGLRKKGWSRYAVKDFERVLEVDEGNVAARIGLARAKLRVGGRSAQQAIPWLREVIEEHPEHGEALWLMARALGGLGRLDEATDAARRATEALPTFGPAWRTLASAQLSRGQAAEAAASARQATKFDPVDPAGWMLLGDAQARRKHHEAAKVSWQRALLCDPPPEMKKRLQARLGQFD